MGIFRSKESVHSEKLKESMYPDQYIVLSWITRRSRTPNGRQNEWKMNDKLNLANVSII